MLNDGENTKRGVKISFTLAEAGRLYKERNKSRMRERESCPDTTTIGACVRSGDQPACAMLLDEGAGVDADADGSSSIAQDCRISKPISFQSSCSCPRMKSSVFTVMDGCNVRVCCS